MTTSGRSRWQSIFALALVAVAFSAARPVAAQKALKPQIEKAQAAALTGRVATILRDANDPGDAEKKVLDDLFMKYLFPSMTAYNPPEVLGQLANSREQLFTRYINTSKSQGARDYLNSKTLLAMSSIAKGPFHPAVRYNAALIVGQLDQTPGTPLPAANEVLIALLENDAFPAGGTKEKPIQAPAPTALKVAAIIGLQRRLAGLEPALAQRITKAATAIALRKETPDDASPEVYGWVRRNAAKLLTAQVAAGMTPEVHQTMVTLISDKTIDLDDRCSIAQLLKPDMYKTAEGLDLNAMTLALGDLAKQVLTLEAKEAKKYEDEMIKGGAGLAPGGGGFGGGFGGRGEMGMRGGFGGGMDMTMPEEMGPTYERRRMIDRLLAIADGANAVAAGGDDESKAKLNELVIALRGVAEPAAEDKALLSVIAPEVQNLSVDVNKLVATWIPAAAEEDEPAEGEFGAEESADEEPSADAAKPADDAEEAPAKPPAAEPAAPAAEPAAEEAAPPAAAEPAAEAPAAAAG